VRLEGTVLHRVSKIEFEQKTKYYFLNFSNRIDMNQLRDILNLIFVTGSRVRNDKDEANILLYKSQQDGYVTDFILSDNCSTCFGGYYHPSSGAQTTVTTASSNHYTLFLSAAIVE